GKLELEVLEVHQVAADVGAVDARGAVRVGRIQERHAWPDAAKLETAHIEDAAEEETRENGHALGARTRDEPRLRIELDHDAAPQRIVEAANPAVANEFVLGAERCRSPFARQREVHAAGGKQPIVSGIVAKARSYARRHAVVEQVGER